MIIQLIYNSCVSLYQCLFPKCILVCSRLLTTNGPSSPESSKTPLHPLFSVTYVENGPTENPLLKNDEKLFQAVFDEHYRSLLYYAKCFLPDLDLSRDVVQEVFSNFWLKRDNIKEKKAIKAYLYVSTRNKCIDILRLAKSKQENERMLSYFFDINKATVQPTDLEFEVIAASTLTLIYKAIEKLPTKYKEVIQLIFYDNLSIEEIALRLRLPYKTVHARKSRALGRLRILFKKYGDL